MRSLRPTARTPDRPVGMRVMTPGVPDMPVSRADRAALFSFWGAVVSALISATVLLLRGGDEASPKPRPAEPTVVVIIVHSGGEGVRFYREPSTKAAHRFGPLFDGDAVVVVCPRRAGETGDQPDLAPERLDQWPVWYQLPNGIWVPDLWTSLTTEPGEAHPRGLPKC